MPLSVQRCRHRRVLDTTLVASVESRFVHVGLDCARALREVEDRLQHGRLHLRLVWGPNGAASSVVVAEARGRSWRAGGVSAFALRLFLRCQLSTGGPALIRKNRSQNCLFGVQADALPPRAPRRLGRCDRYFSLVESQLGGRRKNRGERVKVQAFAYTIPAKIITDINIKLIPKQ